MRVEADGPKADKTVQLTAKVAYAATPSGAACPSILAVQTVLVTFTPTEPGTYVMKGGREDVKVEVTP